MRLKFRSGTVLATMALLVLSMSLVIGPLGRAQAAPSAITKVSTGLVASDPLTTGNTASWTFGGDASSQPGAKFSYAEDSGGLHIAVQPSASGTWAGYYAVSPDSSATLYHATVTLAYSTVPDNGFNTGIYVQTANNDYIDYIGCLAVAVPQGSYWTVVQSYGVIIGSQMINTLYQSPLNALPLTQDCTIITNGNNALKVYIGGNLVVNKNNMTLNMPPPEQVYLEPQSSTASSMLTGTYTNYYATSSEAVQVTNAPVGGTAEILSGAGAVLASAPVGSNGIATILVGGFSLPLSANVEVIDSGKNVVATTATLTTIWGGDVYSVSSSTTSTSSTSSTSSSSSTTSSQGSVTLSGTQSTSGTVSLPPYQFTMPNFNAGSGSNRLLLVGISANSNPVSSVTFGTTQLTLAVSSNNNNDAEFWYLVNPAGSANIVVTMAGATSAVIGAYSLAGVDQANPIPTVGAVHNMLASSPVISITTKFANSWVVDLPSIYGGSTLGSPSCTQHWDANVPNAITGASSSTVASTPGQTTCGWTASSNDLWDDVAIEVKDAPTSASSTTSSSSTSSSSGVAGGITVSAHRIPASYWDNCFATACTNPYAPCDATCTGPGATMYVELQDSAGNVLQSGYADENGWTFTGLTPGVTYYLFPDDCNMCHGSAHNVVFDRWGDGSTVRPLAVTVGENLSAWYSCTNQCAGGP